MITTVLLHTLRVIGTVLNSHITRTSCLKYDKYVMDFEAASNDNISRGNMNRCQLNRIKSPFGIVLVGTVITLELKLGRY